MDNEITELLSFCSQVDFGAVNLSREEEAFRRELNREMLSLCEHLPKSMRTEAALFLVKYLQVSFSDGLNFVNYFYAPAWSILFWLHRFCPENRKPSLRMKDAKAGHAMAMFLHALDDHLTDGQLPITHLTLLMRSESWRRMNQAFHRLARGVNQGPGIVCDLIDDYYSSIGKSDVTGSLDGYCNLFKKQMATWVVVPTLLARKVSANQNFFRSIESVYYSFGIAWRLLDDLQDIEKDMMRGVHSSIYACLNEKLKCLWDKDTQKSRGRNNGCLQTVLRYVLERGVMDGIQGRVCRELESAASIANSCGMSGFARELRCLLKPLKNGQNLS